MRINASKAIKRLGIRNPVTFVATDLKGVARRNGIEHAEAVAGVDPLRPNVVRIDLDAFRRAIEIDGADPRFIIAHELVHVAQLQEEANPLASHYAYQRGMGNGGYDGWRQNRFEQQANELGEWLAPLVEVTL